MHQVLGNACTPSYFSNFGGASELQTYGCTGGVATNFSSLSSKYRNIELSETLPSTMRHLHMYEDKREGGRSCFIYWARSKWAPLLPATAAAGSFRSNDLDTRQTAVTYKRLARVCGYLGGLLVSPSTEI